MKRHPLLYTSICALLIGCSPQKAPSAREEQAVNPEVAQAEASSGSHGHSLKDVMIDAEYMFPDGVNVRGFSMEAAAIVKFKPESIDEFFAMGDTYFVVDTIAGSDKGGVYLIGKSDPNETTAWLVIYDSGMKVLDQIEAFYENAEGNFYLNSSILDNIVTVAGENITPEENPVSAFEIGTDNHWRIIEH